jgi:hypothetical protein
LFFSTIIFSYLKYITFKDFTLFEGEVAEEEIAEIEGVIPEVIEE